MIEKLGIGIDIVDIQKFKKLPYNSNKIFYKKVFHDSEINYCLKFKNPYEHFAGKFALKEAVKKSISKQIDFLDILTIHKSSKPLVYLKNKIYKFEVSITHDKDISVAIVISEKIGNDSK